MRKGLHKLGTSLEFVNNTVTDNRRLLIKFPADAAGRVTLTAGVPYYLPEDWDINNHVTEGIDLIRGSEPESTFLEIPTPPTLINVPAVETNFNPAIYPLANNGQNYVFQNGVFYNPAGDPAAQPIYPYLTLWIHNGQEYVCTDLPLLSLDTYGYMYGNTLAFNTRVYTGINHSYIVSRRTITINPVAVQSSADQAIFGIFLNFLLGKRI